MDPRAGVVHAPAGARRPLGEIVARPRAGAVRVPADHVRRPHVQAGEHLGDAVQVAAAQAGAGEVAVDRPDAERVDRGHGSREAGAQQRGAGPQAASAAAQRLPGLRGRARAGADQRVVGALGERVHPGVERRQDRLVVVGRRALAGQRDRPAGHGARGQALEGGHRGVQVGVVAVDGVDVLAQPDARVDDLHARRRRPLGQRRGQRACVARLDPLLEPEEAGGLGQQPAVDPAGHEPVVVVAGRQQHLADGAAHVLEERPGHLDRVAVRAVAQLEPVTEDHEPVDVVQRRHQPLPDGGAPQHVGPRARADVQVGDHQGPHGALVWRAA